MKRSMRPNLEAYTYRWQPELWTYVTPKYFLLGRIVEALAQLTIGKGVANRPRNFAGSYP